MGLGPGLQPKGDARELSTAGVRMRRALAVRTAAAWEAATVHARVSTATHGRRLPVHQGHQTAG